MTTDRLSPPNEIKAQRARCSITGKEMDRNDLLPLDGLRPMLLSRIRKDFPQLPGGALVSRQELGRYRAQYVEEMLREERGEVTELERQVAAGIANQNVIARNIKEDFAGQRTLGEKLADDVAKFGGSWAFLIAFGVVLAVWIALNLISGSQRAFDPYPFILLNLVLSSLAAIQAPIIMMSQRRQEEKDRLRSQNDYQVNLKAELEIRHLHEKMDHLISRQWQRLAEIQQIQLEMMQEMLKRK